MAEGMADARFLRGAGGASDLRRAFSRHGPSCPASCCSNGCWTKSARRWGARRPRCASARAKFFAPLAPGQRAQLHFRSRRHGHALRLRHPAARPRPIARGILEWDACAETQAPKQWQKRPEAGGRFAPWLLRTLAFSIGRPLARFITFFAALYFMIRRGPERAASRDYLRARARPPRRLARGLPAFPVLLDRDARPRLISWRIASRVSTCTSSASSNWTRRSRAARHAAAVRAPGQLRRLARAEPAQSRRADSHPARRGPERGPHRPAERAESQAGRDHHRCAPAGTRAGAGDAGGAGEATPWCRRWPTGCGPATRPSSPTSSATARRSRPRPGCSPTALHVPVVLAFGLYRGGKRYDLHFERFAFELPRDRRAAQRGAGRRGAAFRGPPRAFRAHGPLQLVQPLRFLGCALCHERSSCAHCC